MAQYKVLLDRITVVTKWGGPDGNEAKEMKDHFKGDLVDFGDDEEQLERFREMGALQSREEAQAEQEESKTSAETTPEETKTPVQEVKTPDNPPPPEGQPQT
jgi:hypothetical protein